MSFLIFFLFFQDPLSPTTPIYDDLPPVEEVNIQNILSELGCDYDEENMYLCDRLPAFKDNSWRHGGIVRFSEKIATLYTHIQSRLPNNELELAIEGVADARKISQGKKKKWENVPAALNPEGLSGEIENVDLALLRAKNVALAIEVNLNVRVRILQPVDHLKTQEKSVGSEFKATTVFIIIGESND